MNSPRLSRRTILAGGAASVLIATGCTQRPGPSTGAETAGITLGIGWWGSDARNEATLAALKIITERKGWQFRTDYGDYGSYFDKLTTQLSGGSAPDICSMNFPGELVDYASRNALLPLDDHVGAALDLTVLTEAEVNPGKVDGTLYGVTLATACPAAMINTTKLDELGVQVPQNWTWETYAEFANSVYEASNGKLHGVEDSTDGVALESFMMQRGYPGVYDGTKLSGTADDYVDWFSYWAELRSSGGCVSAEINAADDGSHPNNPVVKGKAAVGLQFNITEDVWASLTPDKLGYAPYPTSAGDRTGNYIKPASMFSVNAQTEHPTEALEFITLFISDPEVSKTLGLTRGMPNEAATTALSGSLNDKQQAFVDFSTQIADGQLADAPTAPLGSADVGELMTKYTTEVSFGRMEPAQGAQKFFTEASRVELG